MKKIILRYSIILSILLVALIASVPLLEASGACKGNVGCLIFPIGLIVVMIIVTGVGIIHLGIKFFIQAKQRSLPINFLKIFGFILILLLLLMVFWYFFKFLLDLR